jgi:hypothetical protein
MVPSPLEPLPAIVPAPLIVPPIEPRLSNCSVPPAAALTTPVLVKVANTWVIAVPPVLAKVPALMKLPSTPLDA